MNKQDRANISRIKSNRQKGLRGITLPILEPGTEVDILLAIIDRLLVSEAVSSQRLLELD